MNGIRNWSDRYIWRHVVGSRAPQSEPEILREDLGQAEEEMDRLDILNSVSKPYPSAVSTTRLDTTVGPNTRPVPNATNTL